MEILLILGPIFYLVLKMLGYSFFAKYLNYLYKKQQNIWKVGFTRIVIGLTLGFAYSSFFMFILNTSEGKSPIGGENTYLFFAFIILLRIIEWALIVYFFYDKKLIKNSRLLKAILFGTICSFILDVPAFFGLVSGLMVC